MFGKSLERSAAAMPVDTRTVDAVSAIKRASSVDDRNAVLAAVKATNLSTIAGPVSWGKGPVANVTKTPLVGGQWGRGKGVPFDMTIVTNKSAPSIPIGGKLRPLKQA